SELDRETFAGGEHLHPHRLAAGRRGCRQAVDHVVVVGRGVVVNGEPAGGVGVRVVWVRGEPAGADLTGQPHRVLDRAVAPRALAGELGRRVLGVVDQQVDAVAELGDAVGDAGSFRGL